MKHFIKVLPIFLVVFSACEKSTMAEPEEGNALTLDDALLKPNNGYLEHGDKTLIFTGEGYTQKFEGDKLAYNFTFAESIPFTVKSTNNSTAKQEIVVQSTEDDGFLILSNLKELGDGVIEFDAETSGGVILTNLRLHGVEKDTYQTSSLTATCWPCVTFIVAELVEAVVELSNDDIDSNCSKAISSCESGGGTAEVKITADFWGTTSCSVTCK